MKYLQEKKKDEEKEPNLNEFFDVKNQMMTSQIQCFKYNTTLDKKIQSSTIFDAFLSLSQDGREIIITNRKPLGEQKADHEGHLHSHDEEDSYGSTEEVEKKEDDVPCILNQLDQEDVEAMRKQEEEEENEFAFKNVKSSASCMLSEIDSFLFGGCSSRFWMLRKHINSQTRTELDKVPFYSWNCITLKLGRRDVDLVIKDDKQMQLFLKFLIYSLKTLDGVKGSAT